MRGEEAFATSREEEALLFRVGWWLLLSSWGGTFLADAGWFRRWSVAMALLLAARIANWLEPGRITRIRTSFGVGLLLLACATTLQPHQTLLGGADPGVYVNTGIALARGGSWTLGDPGLQELPELGRQIFLRRPEPGQAAAWIRLPGFYVEADPNQGLVTPQFLPFQSIWVGILYFLGGVFLSLYATPLLGLIGTASFYVTAKHLVGPATARVAAVLLCLCPLQTWFARYPTAEIATQALVFLGSAAWLSAGRSGKTKHAVLAGVAWGTVFLARLEPPLLLALLPLILMGQGRSPRGRLGGALVAAWFLTASLAVWQAWTFSHPYTLAIVEAQRWWLALWAARIEQRWLVWLGAFGFALVAVVLGLVRWQGSSSVSSSFWFRTHLRRLTRGPARLALRVAATFAISAWSIYQWWLRPVWGQSELKYHWYSEQNLATYDHENLLRLGWYFTRPGLLLALLGALFVIWRRAGRRTIWFFALLGGYAFAFILDIANNPIQVYAMRRFAPVVVPGLCLLIAVAVMDARRRSSFAKAQLVPFAAVALLMATWLWEGRIWSRQVDFRGALAALEKTAEGLASSDLVFFSSLEGGNELATPWTYILGIPSFVLRSGFDGGFFLRMMEQWQRPKGRVIWAAVDETVMRPPSPYTLHPIGRRRIDLPVLEQRYDAKPEKVASWQHQVELYEVREEDGPKAVDIGGMDLVASLGGFHGREIDEAAGVSYRWTSGLGAVLMQWPSDFPRAELRLRMRSGRSQGTDSTWVDVKAWGVSVGTVFLDDLWREYRFEILRPKALAVQERRYFLIEIMSRTFSPRDEGQEKDERKLGVMLDRLEIR